MPEIDEFRNSVRDVAKVRLNAPKHITSIATETTEVFHLHSEIEFPLVLQFRALRFLEHVQDQFAAVILVQNFVGQRLKHAVNACHWRRISAEVQIGATAFDDHREVFNQIVCVHGEGRMKYER